MDFRLNHKDSPNIVLADLAACQEGLGLLIKSGKGVVFNESMLKESSCKHVKTDFVGLSYSRIKKLIQFARNSREYSYAPYSHFNVGAAILAVNSQSKERIIGGCNVENAAYGSTICAERTASLKAVSEGYRKFLAYAIVGGFDNSVDSGLREMVKNDFVAPCGPCRQVTNEFSGESCAVILAADNGQVFLSLLEFMLPLSFSPKNLGLDPLNYNRHADH